MPAKKRSKTTSTKAGESSRGATKAKRSAKARGGEKRKSGYPSEGSAGGTAPGVATLSVTGSDRAMAAAARSASLKAVVIDALEDMKALEIKVLDVRGLTDVADFMVIASGTSDRHVRSVAQRLVEKAKAAGFRPHGIEGQSDSDWVLIDLNEMIVHVMLPRVREFYGLEKLWDMTATKRAARA